MFVYQALVLVPVGDRCPDIVLGWSVASPFSPDKVAAQWVYGDNALTDPNIKGLDKIERLSFFGEPWTRVPVVLAAFSVLFLTVPLLTNRKQQELLLLRRKRGAPAAAGGPHGLPCHISRSRRP